METTEFWKRCDGCIVPLEVSSHGRVRTLPRLAEARNGMQWHCSNPSGKVLSPWKGANGYLYEWQKLEKMPDFENHSRRLERYLKALILLKICRTQPPFQRFLPIPHMAMYL